MIRNLSFGWIKPPIEFNEKGTARERSLAQKSSLILTGLQPGGGAVKTERNRFNGFPRIRQRNR